LGFEHDVACHRWQEIADEAEVSGADPAQDLFTALTEIRSSML
jgi:hypothetical protein